VSEAHISKAVDSAMDKATAKSAIAPAGVSVRNGPVVEDKMDMDEPATNGATKRKARASTGKPVKYDDNSSESDVPLVCGIFEQFIYLVQQLHSRRDIMLTSLLRPNVKRQRRRL